jgi:hypothetical protein
MTKKKMNGELEHAERKSRAKYECPEKLDFFITLANRYPPESELPDINEFFERARKKLSEEELASLSQNQEWKLAVKELMDSLGESAGWLVIGILMIAFTSVGRLPKSNAIDDILLPDVVTAFVGVYVNIKRDRDNFIKLAKILDDIRKGKREKSSLERFEVIAVPYISESNRLEIESNTHYLEAIKGIDADRLRICEICSRVFWAKRKESETCSTKCFNNLRVRRYRNLTPEEKAKRKAQREANKLQKIKIKKLKEKKNGTL